MNFEKLIQDLLEKNWSLNYHFLSSEDCKNLINEFNPEVFSKAKVGQGQNHTFRPEIRSDSIAWITNENATQHQVAYLHKMSELQAALNRELFLNLKMFECHMAIYKQGEHYSKHTDQFKGNNSRTVTAITYLNTPESGGELVIYNKQQSDKIDAIVKPEAGLMVCFLSDQLYHEVKVNEFDRYSLTGWFKNSIDI
jgi:SM-20-related protein